MVTNVAGPERNQNSITPYSRVKNSSKNFRISDRRPVADLPSATEIAKAVLSQNNPINQVFAEIARDYNLPTLNAMPTSLGQSFNVLSKISSVLSQLQADEKSQVKDKLHTAFLAFYSDNLKLPSATAESSAIEMSNALTNGPEAILKLKNLVKGEPLAKKLGSDILKQLKAHVLKPVPSKTSDRNSQVLDLHQAA